MISHITLGTNQLDEAARFYDGLLSELGGRQYVRTDRAVFWQFGEGGSKLAVSRPFNGEPASAGNGAMVAFTVPSMEKVRQVHARAMTLGATNEGDPGERYGGIYYGAYFRDPDGNKLGVFHLLKPAGKEG